MTIDAIKNEITARLREVKADSSEFKLSENHQDLTKLIAKAIGKVELCETAEELESIDGILSSIEELYNACVAEDTGEPSNEILFDFNFELDDDGDDADEPDEDDETPTPTDEPDEKALRREEKKAEKKQNSLDLYAEAKNAFDEKHTPKSLKKPNVARLCVAFIAIVSGVVGGLVAEFEWWVWSMIGIGSSYLLLSLVYAIVISVGKKSAARAMRVVRLILALIAAVASLILGLVFEFELTLLGAYLATLPFTVFGALSYIIYRIQLFFTLCGIKKRKRKASKK